MLIRLMLIQVLLFSCGKGMKSSEEDPCPHYKAQTWEIESFILSQDKSCRTDVDCELLYISNCGSPEYSKLGVEDKVIGNFHEARRLAFEHCPKLEGPTYTCEAIPHTVALCSDQGQCYSSEAQPIEVQ